MSRELRPETVEPASFALGALCRTLHDMAAGNADAWLLVFLDLLDKASLCDPSEHVLSALHAALASAPDEDREPAAAELHRFEVRMREQLKVARPLRPEQRGEIEILLVVPKPLELEACEAVFECGDSKPQLFNSHLRFKRFPIQKNRDGRGRAFVTLVCMQEAGNLRATNVVHEYVATFDRPDLAILCGMAMGIDPEKTKVGDVVVAKTVHDCSPHRVTVDGSHSRFEQYPVPKPLFEDLLEHCHSGRATTGETLQEAIPRLEEVGLGLPADSGDEDFSPSARPGVTLAGEVLIEDGSGPTLSAIHDRAYAWEMEGAGFASACAHLGSDWMVVRGVADFGEPGRSKKWQGVATAAAASFVKTFLESSWHPTGRP
ncbi:MAG TPA: hypothetical protein VFR75_04340 [Solirubrobacterales bacterium]|nr:hypothetical protein [Solirubrobacterales bacterium]